MRVIAGELKGRKLLRPDSDEIRPTKDRVKEAIFNSLHSYDSVVNRTFLDLFSGTGSLGIEALSRGAISVDFVDKHQQAVDCISSNLEKFNLGNLAQVTRTDAFSHLQKGNYYDVALLDPPYTFDRWHEVLPLVNARTMVIESTEVIELEKSWKILKSQKYGQTCLLIATNEEK